MTNPTPLSPDAQAVFYAFNSKFDWIEDGVPGPQFNAIAAALRAVADQLGYCLDGSAYSVVAKDDIIAIAAELEAQ